MVEKLLFPAHYGKHFVQALDHKVGVVLGDAEEGSKIAVRSGNFLLHHCHRAELTEVTVEGERFRDVEPLHDHSARAVGLKPRQSGREAFKSPNLRSSILPLG